MLFKEAVAERILELCKEHNYTINALAEKSTVPPSTLRGLVNREVENPSAYVIFRICRVFKITPKEFFDSPLFDEEKIVN